MRDIRIRSDYFLNNIYSIANNMGGSIVKNDFVFNNHGSIEEEVYGSKIRKKKKKFKFKSIWINDENKDSYYMEAL